MNVLAIPSRPKVRRQRLKRRPKGRNRRQGGGGVSLSISMASVPFPLKIANWLPACWIGALSAGPTYGLVFSANSVYKFDGTHNAYNFTALSAVYNDFLVDKVRLELTIQNTTAAMGLSFAIYPSANPVGLTSFLAASSQKDVAVGFIAPLSGGPSVVTRTCDLDIKKFFGLQSLSTSDTTYTGSYTVPALPSNVLNFHAVVSASDAATTVTANVTARFWYHTISFGVDDAAQ